MSSPLIASLRSKRLVRLGVGLAALGGLMVVLASARAARIEPAPTTPGLFAIGDDEARAREGIDVLWTLEAQPIERTGYRHGRRHTIEVVPLGPSAVEVEIRTARAFLAMREAAADSGVDLRLESGFRTAEEQRVLFRAWRKGRGNKAARPGQSNHQSGRALDIGGIYAPGALAWLETNAASFGFKRTVKGEPWHWEYVDVPVARGATKRVTRKAAKPTKRFAAGKRPAQRPSSAGKARSSGGRVTASSR